MADRPLGHVVPFSFLLFPFAPPGCPLPAPWTRRADPGPRAAMRCSAETEAWHLTLPSSTSRKIPTMRIAVFASGNGSNFQSIVDATQAGELRAEVVLCVSNRSTAGVLKRAQESGIATLVLDPRDFPSQETYAADLLRSLAELAVDFIALAGYLRKIPPQVVGAFRGRIANIHPALLPSFGGPGMYGVRVHEAVIRAGVTQSGATVHLVDEDYDTGPIVLQDTVPVYPEDTAETLASRVLVLEHTLYPRALSLIADGRIRVEGASVHLVPPGTSTPVPPAS